VNRGGSATWDEAAWATNDYNGQNGQEVGIYSGYFPNNGSWTNGMLTYTTIGNGAQGWRGIGVPANTWVAVLAVGNGAEVYWANAYRWVFSLSYGINGPVVNSAQGEVEDFSGNGGATWMGNGGGYWNEGMWSPDGGSHWYWWGFNNDCANSPYWASHYNNTTWAAGGY
jgi:hypothetical protein